MIWDAGASVADRPGFVGYRSSDRSLAAIACPTDFPEPSSRGSGMSFFAPSPPLPWQWVPVCRNVAIAVIGKIADPEFGVGAASFGVGEGVWPIWISAQSAGASYGTLPSACSSSFDTCKGVVVRKVERDDEIQFQQQEQLPHRCSFVDHQSKALLTMTQLFG